MPIAAGFPRPTRSRNLACTARGQGQARFSPSKSSSSMVTTTMGEAGAFGPRIVNWASRAFSSAISKKRRGLTVASTTTARPARLPARSTRQEAVRDRTDVQRSTREVAAAAGKRLHSCHAGSLDPARRVLGRRVHLGRLQRHAGGLVLLPDQRRGRAGVPGSLRASSASATRASCSRPSSSPISEPACWPARAGRACSWIPSTLKVSAEGGLVRVNLGWTYRTWPLTMGGWDTAPAGADVARPELRPAARHAPPVLTRPGA